MDTLQDSPAAQVKGPWADVFEATISKRMDAWFEAYAAINGKHASSPARVWKEIRLPLSLSMSIAACEWGDQIHQSPAHYRSFKE